MKRIGYFLTVGALAAAMLAGCSTSNQKAEETTAAPTQRAQRQLKAKKRQKALQRKQKGMFPASTV